ncbi:hypothetical protein BJX66DRAFT_287007 [Aspergillus keveii]|uniref:Uncharacterized protein n=1 Tax=Aspergillus keveii TaxID=714993 RepID=A0ABR4FVT2_9EURO
MKLTTAIPSLLLVALAPSVAGQELLGFVGITDSSGAVTSWPASATCFDYPGGPIVASAINVPPLAARCTFFSNPSCGGNQIILNTGPHTFVRRLIVGSWSCEAQPQTPA